MRLIIRVFTALIITVMVLAGVLILLPGEKVAELAADQLEKQTGRKLEFGGPVRFTLWPTLGVKADGVTLSNAEWAGPEPMLTAERLTIGIAAADLTRGNLRVTEVSAILPHLNLATNAEGAGNWVLEAAPAEAGAGAAADEGSAGPVKTLAIEAVSLTGASFAYKPQGGDALEMRQIDVTLAMPDPAGTVDLEMILRPGGSPVTVEGEIGTFSDFLAGQVASAGVSVVTGSGMARFDGRADIRGEADGRLTLQARDTAAMLAALGIAGVELPRGLGQAAEIGTDVTYTSDGRLSLRDLAMDLDGNTLNGAADIVLGPVPQVTARLRGGDLVIPAAAASGGAETGSSGQGGSGWPADPIDASALGLAEGTLDLSFSSLQAGGYAFGESAVKATLERSRAVLEMSPLAVFGGALQGQVVANNRKGFSTGGKLSFSGIRLEQALAQTAGYERLNGEALGEVEFLGSGGSVDAIMKSLSGQGWLEIGKGFFTGFDLEAITRGGSGNGGSTVFDRLTGSYTISGGNLDNQDLLLSLKSLNASGRGRVGLGAQDLDYTLTVNAPGAGLSVPVRITGPWADPSVRPDLAAAVSDEAEAAAKEELRLKLQEELGAEIAPDADVEEVIKDELEQRAKDSLLRLLGGN
jgi:AsmA protein